MTAEEFRKNAHKAVDWVADYLEQIESLPVKSQVQPKDIYQQIPATAPEQADSQEALFSDLSEIILPGITHWQHPHFHAYFPGNSSYPSVIAEIITAGLGAQCMVWETSPAAAELEERMMEWLKELMSLPAHWSGTIQDTASTASLTAILSAREKHTNFSINNSGFANNKLRVYCSYETHSSIEKGVKIAGIGKENLVKIAVDDKMAMIPEALNNAIMEDIAAGYTPCCVVAALGTTGTLAFDSVTQIGEICKKHGIWLHVDAAYAGSALILPEETWLKEGLDLADSFVFNPHKWLFTNFDCSVYFVKDKETLLNTFEILPEYLKTKTRGQVNDYRDWGIQLGRRFRALKLWWVMRTFGAENMRQTLRNHISWTHQLENQISAHANMQLLTPRKLNVLVFRYTRNDWSEETHNLENETILQRMNQSGKVFLSHTKVRGQYGIRVVLGQTYLQQRHVEELWSLLAESIES